MTARRDPERFLARLWAMEDRLVAAGLPPQPAWWRSTNDRFERHGKRRRTIRKGRRVYASTCVAPRLGVAEMLFGEHLHTPGTPPLVYAFLSVKREEAANRLRGVKAILDILGEAYAERGETIELKNRPARFAVMTASFKLSVGETVAWAWCDEVSRWNDEGANPAEEVIGALAPALATLPNASLWLVSSPLGEGDYHARQFELGETPAQSVAFGATWEINTTLTEEETRALEPDPDTWSREYAAIPSQGETTAFLREHVVACYRPNESFYLWERPFMVIDAGERVDSFSYLLGTWGEPDKTARHRPLYGPPGSGCEFLTIGIARDDRGIPISVPIAERPLLHVYRVGGWTGPEVAQIGMDRVTSELAQIAKADGIDIISGDQRGAPYIAALLSHHGIRFKSYAWTQELKHEAVSLVRAWMRDRQLRLAEHDTMRTQLLRYRRRVVGGGFRYGVPNQADDYAAALLTCAMRHLEERGSTTADTYAPIHGAPTEKNPGGRTMTAR
jgi:hypothetical protein